MKPTLQSSRQLTINPTNIITRTTHGLQMSPPHLLCRVAFTMKHLSGFSHISPGRSCYHRIHPPTSQVVTAATQPRAHARNLATTKQPVPPWSAPPPLNASAGAVQTPGLSPASSARCPRASKPPELRSSLSIRALSPASSAATASEPKAHQPSLSLSALMEQKRRPRKAARVNKETTGQAQGCGQRSNLTMGVVSK